MEEKRTIVHIRASNFVGGPEKQILEHLKRLNRQNFQGWLISFKEGRTENELLLRAQQEGLNHIGIPMAWALDLGALFRLIKTIRQIKADLLCVHGYKACLMGWGAGEKVHIPVMAFSRGDTGENQKVAFYEWLERRFLPKMDGIIAVSEGQKRKLESQGIKGETIGVVQNAVAIKPQSGEPVPIPKEEIFHRLAIPAQAKLVVSAGRLSPEKGHRYLVEAIAGLKIKQPGAFFLFCGDGPCREALEKQAHELGVLDRTLFSGFRRDLPEIFSVMDLFVLPSLSEGLPNVILEAFASGKPVVASDVGGVSEIVNHEVNGLLVPPQQSDHLAEAIERILSDPLWGKEMGNSGHEKVKAEFTFEAQTEKLEKRYLQVLSAFERAGR